MTSQPFDKQIAQHQVRQVYRGDLSTEETQQLQVSLEENSDAWEQFLAAPETPHELSPDEADVLLQVILQQTEAPQKEKQTAPQESVWQTLLQTWQQWAALPAALAFLVIIGMPWMNQGNEWNHKGNLKAFIKLKIHRHHKQDHKKFSVIPFEQNGYYKTGDAFLFRFLVIEKGYLYLYRQDIKGNLEQLFPFKETDHKLYKAGHHDLIQSPGKPLAYFLDRKLEGHQTFWLLHSDKPMNLPKHWSKLSQDQQRKLKRHSDRIQVTVFPH